MAIEEGGEVVGYCVCTLESQSAHLISIAVHRSYRRKGVGIGLLEKLFEHMALQGAKEMWLEVSVKNKEAIALYTKLGFGKRMILENYYSDGSDALRMQSELEHLRTRVGRESD